MQNLSLFFHNIGKALPCGIDIGGTLAKVAFFECSVNGNHNVNVVNGIHAALGDYVKSSRQYGSEGERDERLEMRNIELGSKKGNLHFIRFPTSRMDEFFKLTKEVQPHEFSPKKVYATGGGAYKFDDEFKEVRYVCSVSKS